MPPFPDGIGPPVYPKIPPSAYDTAVYGLPIDAFACGVDTFFIKIYIVMDQKRIQTGTAACATVRPPEKNIQAVTAVAIVLHTKYARIAADAWTMGHYDFVRLSTGD